MEKNFDVVVIGAGVSGSALLYVLSKYTNVKKILLLEKNSGVAEVNSSTYNNSQTLHFGDIETNYSFEKAKKVSKGANLVKNYVEKYDGDKKCFTKYHKMVLAVGNEECKKLEERYKEFKKIFPNLKLITREEIAKIETEVIKGREKVEKIIAIYSSDGYAIDFRALSESFLKNSQNDEKNITCFFESKAGKIIKNSSGGYDIFTNKGLFRAKAVAVEAGAHSLLFAKSLGYWKDYALLSVAGSFYLSRKKLNGKVYTMQIGKLPFAAIHGDPEVHDASKTRFGPTAKVLPMLERRNYKSVYEYFKIAGLSFKTINSFFKILSDKTIFSFVVKNLFFDLPFIGKRLFIKEVRKIIPAIKANEIYFAKGYGGVRPQVVNTKTGKLEMGEAKVMGDRILFNITPSPGASTCLRNAMEDTRKIIDFLGKGFKFNEGSFLRDLS